MKAGTQVRLIQPVIQGEVKERRINPADDELEVLVAYTDAEGQPAARWFRPEQLEQLEVQP